jgi:hypothetical protein
MVSQPKLFSQTGTPEHRTFPLLEIVLSICKGNPYNAPVLYFAMLTGPDKDNQPDGLSSSFIRWLTWWRQSGMRSHLAAHPFLFGCLFVLQGYAQLQPMGSRQELFAVLTAVLGAILLLQLAFLFFVRQPRKPALLASLCVVLFCFLGNFQLQMVQWTQESHWVWLARLRWILPVAGVVFLALFSWVLRTPRALLTTRRYLDAVSALLLALTLVTVFRAPPQPVIRPGDLANTPMDVGGQPPDIYYILTDAYTSPESLKSYWDYDDSAFVNGLTSLGFHVLKNAHSNATFTPICLSTYLNMNYPTAPPRNWSIVSQVAWFCQIIRQAEAPLRLKASGYDVRSLSIFDVAGQRRLYSYPGISDPSLGSVLWGRLALGMLWNSHSWAGWGDKNLKLFSLLPRIAAERTGKPKFVYAHLLIPHSPYLFDEKGRRILRGMPGDQDRPEDYLRQLIYANTLITNAVAGILKNSQTPPIIIIQGDHGYRYLPGSHRNKEATTILNALYLPGPTENWLYPGITPVNTFRVLFNHYFGQHYRYLPDVVPSRISRYVEVPDAD